MQKVRKYFKIEGRVQGINFRWFVIDTAKNFAITGWVRNCADSSVELEAQGRPDDLKKFETAIKNNHPVAVIKKIEEQNLPLVNNEQNFNIIY
jgi:acylphosphatase